MQKIHLKYVKNCFKIDLLEGLVKECFDVDNHVSVVNKMKDSTRINMVEEKSDDIYNNNYIIFQNEKILLRNALNY